MVSAAGTPPPNDPPDPPDGPVATDSEHADTPEDADWNPDTPEAWGGATEVRDEWRPEDPSAWEKVRGSGQALRPGRIRRTKHHRRIIRRSRSRASAGPFDLNRRSRLGTGRGFRGRGGRRRIVKLVLLALFIVMLGGLIALADAYYQSYRIYKNVRGVPSQLSEIRQQLSLGELPPDDRFATMTQEVEAAQHLATDRLSMKVARVIPFLNRPIVAVDRGLEAAHEETEAATGMRDIVRDALGDVATGQTRFAPASETPIFHDGKVDVALLESLTPRLEAVAAHLHAADEAIRSIPAIPFVHKLDTVKADATVQSAKALTLIQDALTGARLLPSFLGADSPKTYFLAMQNNADQRATGGAVLAYAFVKIDDGKLQLTGGGSVYDFDQQYGFSGVDLPSSIAWYLDHVTLAYPRLANINYSPDFPLVSEAWAAVLRKATGKRIDGAIAIDPIAVSYLLGKREIHVPSYDHAITAGNVVRVVENDQYRLPFAQQQAFPAQLIGQAWEILKNPTPFVRTLKQMATGIKEKHIQLWSTDPELQGELSKLGWDGAVRMGEGDYLYVTDNKIRSNKVDYYSHISVDYTVDVDANGTAHVDCQVTLENDAPPGETRFIIGPNKGLNEAMIGLLVPKGAQIESTDPRNGPPDHVEGAALMLLRTLRVLPGESKVARFVYTVPNAVISSPDGKLYRLTIQHQPFVNPVELSVKVSFPSGTALTSASGWKVDGNVATFQSELTQDLVREIHF
jgi:uncharacterized protein DUF4012